jgi:2-amino-4-hydroxy-6-hydroxymethyldihydropteridine diphosphokinase
MTEIGLSLGSNLGDRLANLKAAKRGLAGLRGLTVGVQSPVYETAPVGVPSEFEHHRFLNTVLIADCRIEPIELSTQIRAIEKNMGRQRNGRLNVPRTIDIDVIYVGQLQITTEELTVPHPRWADRVFVAKPLTDVRPNLTIPGTTGTVREVLTSLGRISGLRTFAEDW